MFKVPQMIPFEAQFYVPLMFHHRKSKLHLIDTKESLNLHNETFIMTFQPATEDVRPFNLLFLHQIKFEVES